MSDLGRFVAPGIFELQWLLPAPLDRVWPYFAQAAKRATWLAGGDDLPPVAGNEFELQFNHASLSPVVHPTPERFKHLEQGVAVRYRVVRIDPPRLLVISWCGATQETTQTQFELADESGRVRLKLTYARDAEHSVIMNVVAGWHTHLSILGDRLAGRTPAAYWSRYVPIELQYLSLTSSA